jgi:5-oxoprolinase (ATP-hydrolysing)
VIDNPDFADELFEARAAAVSVEPARTVSAYFEYADGGHRSNVPFHRLSDLPQGAAIQGPAILADMTQTIVVEPECVARILKKHVIIDVEAGCDATTSATSAIGQANGCADMHVNGDGNDESELTPDPVTLAVFANRFMSIAEQMGVLFERTSISLSIKERLDFSCSIHTGDDGGLVANAPHIPIHLGSMADAVRRNSPPGYHSRYANFRYAGCHQGALLHGVPGPSQRHWRIGSHVDEPSRQAALGRGHGRQDAQNGQSGGV